MVDIVASKLKIRKRIFNRLKESPFPKEVVGFALIGLLATGVHASIGFVGASLLDLPVNIANFMGFIFAWSVSYFGHSNLSFKDHGQGKAAFCRFILHSVVMFLLSSMIANITQHNFGLEESMIPVIAAVSIPLLSLVSTKLFVFRKFKI